MAPFRISVLRAIAFAGLAALASTTTLSAQTLTWNANTESTLAGYRIQYGTVAGSPSTTLDVGRITSRQMTGLQAGVTYYFRVVAYNTTGQTSAPSLQVSYTVAGTPPAPTSPTLTAVSPTSGPTLGGTTITLTGTNFVSGATVRVGGVAATSVAFASSTGITARTPAGTAGARDVVVTNPDGRAATRTGAFTYTSTPTATLTATAVSPLSGPTGGGTAITVTGTGFVAGATVAIGGTAATGVTFVSSTQLTARTPAKPVGGYSVVVRNPNGQTANTPRGFTYTSGSTPPPPSGTLTATAVSPLSGPTSGGTLITVTGTNFVAGATIRIGGVAATGVTFVSATQLRARTPARPVGGYPVQVFNPSGQSANTPRGFTYVSGGTSSATMTSLAPQTLDAVESAAAESDALGARSADANSVDGASAEASVPPAEGDADADGLPTDWETRYGLDAASAAGDDGAAGDPDGDGVSNDAEFAAGSHPRGVIRRYLAEGIESEQMHTRLAIANPEQADAHVLLTFLTATGASARQQIDVPARSRRTVDLSTVPELAGASFSTVLEADGVVALDRRVSFGPAGRAASVATAVDEPSATWSLAPESTAAASELFYLVLNPGETDAQVQVSYLRPDGAEPLVRSYPVAAHSRATIWVDRQDPSLAATEVGAEIRTLEATPIVVERTSYVTEASSAVPRSGATQAGRTSAAVASGDDARIGGARWLMADSEPGSTAAATTLTVSNRGAATQVRVTLLFEDGAEVATTLPVASGARVEVPFASAFPAAAGRRFSVLVEGADPAADLIVDRAVARPVGDRTRTTGAEGSAARLP
ncbi:MAG: IPT/TIG domain-containing protein [Vicinamibacteraceae bacterium]